MHTSNTRTQGNVLFLILIAVVLFAALSYAVTQSSRGGGNSDNEKMKIEISVLLQQAAMISFTMQRLDLRNDIDGYTLSTNAYNASGTYYNADGSSSTGRTVGIFNAADGGMNPVYPPEYLYDTNKTFNSYKWILMHNSNKRVGGVNAGTATGDVMLIVGNISQEACAAINEVLNGTNATPSVTYNSPYDRDQTSVNRDGTNDTYGGMSANYNYTFEQGCEYMPPPAFYFYHHPVHKAN